MDTRGSVGERASSDQPRLPTHTCFNSIPGTNIEHGWRDRKCPVGIRRGHFCYVEGRRCHCGAGRAPPTSGRFGDLVPKEQFASAHVVAGRGISVALHPRNV